MLYIYTGGLCANDGKGMHPRDQLCHVRRHIPFSPHAYLPPKVTCLATELPMRCAVRHSDVLRAPCRTVLSTRGVYVLRDALCLTLQVRGWGPRVLSSSEDPMC
eukprot:1189795-Prorocentrum_minimum.AAC.2